MLPHIITAVVGSASSRYTAILIEASLRDLQSVFTSLVVVQADAIYTKIETRKAIRFIVMKVTIMCEI